MTTKNPVVSSSRIITLLESNDASNSTTAGQWSNNLNENTILREGDSLFVRQSMIDTTTESGGLIDVASNETDITIQYGMYLQDSGNGTEDGGNAQTIDFLSFSEGNTSSPSGKNYILQNHTTGLPNHEIWYTAGPTGIDNLNNPGTSPANDFSIQFIPSTGAGDWWEYTIETAVAYAAPVGGPFPLPPTTAATSPILLKANLQGMKCIFKTGVDPTTKKTFAYYNVYANGWTPASGTPNDTDHIADIEVLYNAAGRPRGYQSTIRNVGATRNPVVANQNDWVFRPASYATGGGTQYQYWNNVDPITQEESTIYRVCTSFRMIVDNYGDISGADAPYQTTLTYTSYSGKQEARMFFGDWGRADTSTFGKSTDNDDGLFFQHIVNGPTYGLPDLSKGSGRVDVGFAGQSTQNVFWINFAQLTDSRNVLNRTFEPFVYDVHDGIAALPFGFARAKYAAGKALGVYNPMPKGDSNKLLEAGQITSIPLPLPNADGVLLTPRIFTQKITIPEGKYTYDALAQKLTDKLNQIPRVVPQLNNNPFAATPPADNPIGFSGSRLLTSTYEIAMQQTNEAAVADRVPFFPSNYTYVAGDAVNHPLLQPIWLDETGENACQFVETSLAGPDNPRWCGAEALSFIYDESSDTFQMGQAHSNIYSRLDGGVIARQFKVGAAADQYTTCDKNGGIFLTSLEPTTLFFDKMKLQRHNLLVEQLGQNPATRNIRTGDIDATLQQNVNLTNALCHSISLRQGDNITGNFLGLGTKIDKRTRIIAATGETRPVLTGGDYGAVRTEFDLDVAVDTPITCEGFSLADEEVTDPYFQVEISGINRQDIVGANTKNNLIQTIVGKYFTNGGYTSGNLDDGIRYTHLGEPLNIRSMNIRILDSNGNVADGLGPNSAVILELDSDK